MHDSTSLCYLQLPDDWKLDTFDCNFANVHIDYLYIDIR